MRYYETTENLRHYIQEDDEKRLVAVDVPYGTHVCQRCDICIPKNLSGDAGLILYIHGGGFLHGDKAGYMESIKSDSENGFVCASVNYRFADAETGIDDMMEDITHALILIRNIAEQYGVSLHRMLLTGGSAGAHLLLLYAYTQVDTAPIRPAAAVAYCPSTNVAERKMIFDTRIGCPENMAILFSHLSKYPFTPDTFTSAVPALEKISSYFYVHADTVPTVIAHGLLDDCVPFDQAQMLDEKLEEYGVPHKLIVYPNSGHALERDPDKAAQTHELLIAFAEKYLTGKP